MDYAIGIDLGGTKIKFIITDYNGNILDIYSKDTTDKKNPNSWLKCIKNEISNIEKKIKISAKKIGIAAPGMASKDKSKIISLPGRLSGLENLNWTKFLNKNFFIPVINDAHAALYGEYWKGSAKNYNNIIFLTLGTGIGGAFSINGKLQEGILGRAGHFGHTCIDPYGKLGIKNTPGSIESFFGEYNIYERTKGKFKSTFDLVKSYIKGDKEAKKLWLRQVYLLACSITSFINILDPELVLLGGGISEANKALLNPLKKFMKEIEWRPFNKEEGVDIKISSLKNKAGALGAIYYSINNS